MQNIEVDGRSLTLEQFDAIVSRAATASLGEEARRRIATCRATVDAVLNEGKVVYGVTTGFGDLATVRIEPENIETLQERLILSHCAGVGAPLPDKVVRGMLLLRASTLSRGYSGVRVELVEALLRLLETDVLPVIPSRGSVGASGDLAPLAHLALPLLGRGRVRHDNEVLTAREGLAIAGLQPLTLQAKEGLALINGTQGMTSLLCVAISRCRRLVQVADLIGAMTTEALRGTDTAFDSRLHALRPHPGQIASAANLWKLMQGSAIRESHRHDDVRIQDPYSVRCMPQVHGAVRDVLEDVIRKANIEINAVTDNPLVFPDQNEVLSGGNFHGEPIALAADVLGMAVSELASIAERRIEKLTNTAFSALPPFLVKDAGLNSGFMIAQVTAAALVSENKTIAHPASIDSIPTSADKEDHVSMGMWAALKLQSIIDNTEWVLAIELLCAAQGVDLLRPLHSSERLEAVHEKLRTIVPMWDIDREMAPDIESALGFLGDLDLYLEDLA